MLKNLGIDPEICSKIETSLKTPYYKGKIAVITKDQLECELWRYGVDPNQFDFDDNKSVALARDFLRDNRKSFLSFEISQVEKNIIDEENTIEQTNPNSPVDLQDTTANDHDKISRFVILNFR